MKKFIANRIIKGEINTIIGTLDLTDLTYTEEWYFEGIIYRKEIRYSKNTESAQCDFDLACQIYNEQGINLILS